MYKKDTNTLANTKRGAVSERILRVLLNHQKEKLTKYRITKAAKANISWVIEFLRKLERKGIVEGTKVKNYRELVTMWKSIRNDPDSREYAVRDVLDLLKKTNMKYALTTYSAENLVQKYLFPSRTDFYILQKDEKKWHRMLSEKGLVGKGNVRVLITDDHVFYNSLVREGLTTVSIPQLIVDLMVEGAVAAEAAEMLIKKEEEQIVSRK